MKAPLLPLLALLAVAACGGVDEEAAPEGCEGVTGASRTASCVASVQYGAGAGFGQASFPDVVLGPPRGAGTAQGGTDVLSLGVAGAIVVGFGAGAIVDGPGPDFVVFENAFFVGGNPERPYADLGAVSVSDDGASWVAFPCHAQAYPYDGCAGWHPVLVTPDSGDAVFDPARSGGDPFDLADVGLRRARFVRVDDLSDAGAAPTAGFDLDAVAIVNPEQP